MTAKANRCHAVRSREFGFSAIVGFTADIAATELVTAYVTASDSASNRPTSR